MKPAALMLPGFESSPDEPKNIRTLRFIGSLEVDADTFDKLEEYAELRGQTLQVACQECLTRFFSERASGVDAMKRHDAAADGWSQYDGYDPESGL